MATRTRTKIPSHYLGIWALLMTISLSYMGAMTLRPDLVTAAVPPVSIGALLLDEDDRELRAAAAEAETLRRQLFNARAEINGIRGELNRRADRETTLTLKLAAIEAREAKQAEAQVAEAAASLKVASTRPPEKARLPKSPVPSAVERLANAQPGALVPKTPTVEVLSAPATTASVARPPPAETASLPAPKTDAGAVAIQLGTGPSVDALRLNWTLLSQRHQATLQKLQPRYTANRGPTGGNAGTYDLLAGPIPNAADAQRLCEQLRAQNVSCKVGPYGGNAL